MPRIGSTGDPVSFLVRSLPLEPCAGIVVLALRDGTQALRLALDVVRTSIVGRIQRVGATAAAAAACTPTTAEAADGADPDDAAVGGNGRRCDRTSCIVHESLRRCARHRDRHVLAAERRGRRVGRHGAPQAVRLLQIVLLLVLLGWGRRLGRFSRVQVASAGAVALSADTAVAAAVSVGCGGEMDTAAADVTI